MSVQLDAETASRLSNASNRDCLTSFLCGEGKCFSYIGMCTSGVIAVAGAVMLVAGILLTNYSLITGGALAAIGGIIALLAVWNTASLEDLSQLVYDLFHINTTIKKEESDLKQQALELQATNDRIEKDLGDLQAEREKLGRQIDQLKQENHELHMN